MLSDGYTDVPPGKIAAVVTYLQMTAPPPVERQFLDLVPLRGDPARYRALFRRVGEPWLWFSRAGLDDARLAAILARPGVEAWALRAGGEDAGLLELDFGGDGACELVYFGLVPGRTGQGLGQALMTQAIARAFSGRSRGYGCIPAPSTTPAPCRSTSARASRPIAAPSRSPTIRASRAGCRSMPRPIAP
jgi:GNAT superfamily N-acetyltransferase